MLRRACCALVALGAAACGEVKTIAPADPDAGPDPDAGEVAPGEVTVEVDQQLENHGEPLVDTPVLFFGPDGVFLSEDTTDEDGMASGTVPPDATVVVAGLTPQGESLAFAVFGVQPGDEIVFSALAPVPDLGEVMGNMSVQVPALAAETGVVSYTAYNGCGSASVNHTDGSTITGLAFDSRCVVDDEVDVLVRAFDADGEVIEMTSKHDTFVVDDTVVIASWKGIDDLGIPVTEVSAEVQEATFQASPRIGGLSFGSVSEAVFLPGAEPFGVGLARLDTFGDQLLVSVTHEPSQVSLRPQTAHYVLEPDAPELPLALDEELLPWLGTPAYSEADHRWSWTRTEGRAPDAQFLFFYGTRKEPVEQFGWIVVVPPDRDSVTLPQIPDEHEEYRFESFADIEGQFLVALETNDHDGYEIRRLGLRPFWQSLAGGPPDTGVGSTWRVSLGGNQ